MTVKELITRLLDAPMDAQVQVLDVTDGDESPLDLTDVYVDMKSTTFIEVVRP